MATVVPKLSLSQAITIGMAAPSKIRTRSAKDLISEEGLLPCEVGPDAIVPVSSSGGKMSGKGKGPLDPAFAAGFNAMFLVICLKCLEVRTQHLLPTTSYPIKGQ